ncbi:MULTISPECIES: DUF1269 domain-containing protein [unclassified Rhodococcus (in: high G+C Gram-positive bacteria)]|uniref:DUF1269 domain-containing protein n=1 Tax=unclassified Rhodococcus (in: high G+C Gram-positive bacteria) TaxID=192944 RepID=UPI0006D2CB60|nr:MULTISPECIES: DUF1269 domain-containing protein [unclassified Rhodococcus (in: high G+C Gram-positive bacteria)]NLU65424.1 DUF1269 domain-containing protein [Rhodococcus sp. HNM0563]TCN46746.1 putative membrane protein [Rhodococcus sp. SMB37]
MAGTLTVWKFDTETGADTAVETLKDLQRQELITVHDAAVVSWAEGAKKPKTRQLNNLAGIGALGGAFWGLLFGILFFIPLIGAAVGAGIGALSGSLTDVGIDDSFIKQLKEKITPGTSALFVLTSDATLDRVHDEFKGQKAELISTNLSHDQEAALREVFAE